MIPASSISSTLLFTKARWSGLKDLGGIFVRKVDPSGMFSLWTAPGIALTSFIDRAKQSAYSRSSLWMIWRWLGSMSGPIVTSWMILAMRSGLRGLDSRVKRDSGFASGVLVVVT